MKTKPAEDEIRSRIEKINADERYHAPAATIEVNAPLALIQAIMETEIRALAWVLGITPPRPRRGGKK